MKRLNYIARLERLDQRLLNAADFCNSFNPLDVNDDGFVSPLDALVVINDLNSKGSSQLIGTRGQDQPYVDVDGDDHLSPRDALIVVNLLNRGELNRSIDLPLISNLSFASDPNGNGVVLRPDLEVQGQAAAGVSVRVKVDGQVQSLSIADAGGNFSLPVTLSSGRHSLRIEAVNAQSVTNWTEREVIYGDVVQDWNAAMLNVIRDWTTFSNDPYSNRIVTERPPVAARNLAIMHVAMFDAINSISQTYQPYLASVSAPAASSAVAAAATAAHRVASRVYSAPNEQAAWDASLLEALSLVTDETAKSNGIRLGEQIADLVWAARAQDGSQGTSSYRPVSEVGHWNRTFPDFLPPLLAQWPSVKPFALTSGDQFRPAPPPALDSAEYAVAVDEVMQLGEYQSHARSAEQTEIALFWADGGGTFTPPGHWNKIATDVSAQLGNSLEQNARLFALLNVAMADAGIASWDAKYFYDVWRPIDAIRRGDADNNANTQAQPNWMPLIKTPPFPTYTSGHSTFSAAAAQVLSELLGDQIGFTSTADGHDGFRQRPLAASAVATRSFDNFWAAAEEAGRSRIYGGIHFEFDNQAGLALGRQIGDYVLDHLLHRAPQPTGASPG